MSLLHMKLQHFMGMEAGNPFAFMLNCVATIQTKYAGYPELYLVPRYI